MMGRSLNLLALCLLVIFHFSCSRKIAPAASKALVIDEITSPGLNDSLTDVIIAAVDSSNVFIIDTIGVETDSILKSGTDTLNTWVEFLPDSLLTDTLALAIEEEPDTIVIIGTGDIMPGTNFPDNRYLPPGGAARLFDPVEDVLQSGDVTFGNLEGVFSSQGGTAKKCNNPKTCYVFRMPDEYLEVVLDAGYDVLSVANNHVNDFGYEGRLSTYRLLEASGVPFAGFISQPSTTFEQDGVKYGFAAFAPHSGTANLKDYQAAAAIVAELEEHCDIVIVSFHGGAEGRDHQHIPCTDEIYLGYNRGNVCKFAHMVVDAGADIVFGHGPHVARAMELYNDRLICYSLGNFCTYARFNLSGPNGIAPIVKASLSETGEFLFGEVIPVYQAGEGGPRLDPQNRVITKLQELMTADFPGGSLQLDDDGSINIKEDEN